MKMRNQDEIIAAVATPPGTGGVAVVRVSGKGAAEILPRVFSAKGPYEHGRMVYGRVLRGNETVDTGYAVVFYGPKSYTGQDTVELQVHGGAVSTAMVLETVLEAGARIAEPGEFTKRAFLNGRMDLSQAQAVGDLIGALSEAGAKLAVRQTREDLRLELLGISNELKDICARTEAVLEYPDEDIEEAEYPQEAQNLRRSAGRLLELAATVREGQMIKDGLHAALAGAPNAGKSSLFNAICRENAAIVTSTPGTTRDLLHRTINVRGAAVHLADTAGLCETENEIEREGVRRAVGEVEKSDVVLFMLDGSKPVGPEDMEAWNSVKDLEAEKVVILSKADLGCAFTKEDAKAMTGAELVLAVSAVSGEGLGELLDLLYERTCADVLREETVLLSDLRQKEHLTRAAESLESAAAIFETGADADCACIDIRDALRETGCITGEYADEEIIDRIFSKFCLGK